MTKTELIKAITDKTRTTVKKASAFLNAFIDIVSENLENTTMFR